MVGFASRFPGINRWLVAVILEGVKPMKNVAKIGPGAAKSGSAFLPAEGVRSEKGAYRYA